jgi:hypothetical protein
LDIGSPEEPISSNVYCSKFLMKKMILWNDSLNCFRKVNSHFTQRYYFENQFNVSKHNMLLHYFQTTLQKKALISLIVFWYDIATNVFKEYPKSILQLIYFIGNYNKQKSTCNFLLQSFSWSFELRIIVLSNERQVFNNSNWYRNN